MEGMRCWKSFPVFGISCLQRPTPHDISRKLNRLHEASLGQVFGASVTIVKQAQQDLNPYMGEDECGHRSHYGVGALIDIVTLLDWCLLGKT